MSSIKVTVEVFKTNITNPVVARKIGICLASSMEGSMATFDLQDVDRILRIASPQQIQAEVAIAIVTAFGFHASLLPDTIEELAPEFLAEPIKPHQF